MTTEFRSLAVTTGRPIFVAADDGQRNFVSDDSYPGPLEESPVVLDCADLRTAQRRSRGMRVGPGGLRPVPILRVHTLDAPSPDAGGRVMVLPEPRALASLAIDLRLLGIADGIIIHTAESLRDELAAAVRQQLQSLGYRWSPVLPGWILDSPYGYSSSTMTRPSGGGSSKSSTSNP